MRFLKEDTTELSMSSKTMVFKSSELRAEVIKNAKGNELVLEHLYKDGDYHTTRVTVKSEITFNYATYELEVTLFNIPVREYDAKDETILELAQENLELGQFDKVIYEDATYFGVCFLTAIKDLMDAYYVDHTFLLYEVLGDLSNNKSPSNETCRESVFKDLCSTLELI